MEMLIFLKYLTVLSFLFTIISVVLMNWRTWFGIVAIVCFLTFITSLVVRGNTASQHLEEIGCEYIGSGKKGMPHTPPKKYYTCPDGIIRVN